MVLVVVEHDRGVLTDATLEAIAAVRSLDLLGPPSICALTIGESADGLAQALETAGVAWVVQAHHPLLGDYGPETWGETLAQVVRHLLNPMVIGCGTDRGNEVMAQAAARLDAPFVANCTELAYADRSDDPLVQSLDVVRLRWGGSLLERAAVDGDPVLLTVAPHAFVLGAGQVDDPAVPFTVDEFVPVLDPSLARTIVADRVERVAGVTLATAPFVVGGGRGVGSPEGFAPLEELAGLLGGVVGCSRAVTNAGWRNHTDQVGQTGTRIAPDLYLACGISGAIQHWVGAMASKQILAINTDPQANMVTRADYAVIGDLHKVVPAISAELRRRRAERT
jgi:electron transfer flavoprotein alpha subunit